MYKLEIGKLQYKYLVGPHVVAIITPKRKICKYLLSRVQSNPSLRIQNGTADSRVSPEEVADFIVKHRLK